MFSNQINGSPKSGVLAPIQLLEHSLLNTPKEQSSFQQPVEPMEELKQT
ncbi:uncharacterized protein G2W53_013584 [Senna tora]|uniref:Uncharacterized protein n=1 Tax=Senna tora TaxID=362788 RepID=A0A834U2J8_9FABA|nr:uncharacterized protein G2W53_013584 [Senna tora]